MAFEERSLGLQLVAERKARVAVHGSLQPARSRREHSEIEAPRRMLEIQSGAPEI